ncbi:hypothetical protein DD582_32515 [Klebsiella pneumoniae]|nr:hypothetical protein DD582_32515 [Klebsiella pneumoniae]
MTVHDAIPKERGLSVSFSFYAKIGLWRGCCDSYSGERMKGGPGGKTKRRRRIGKVQLCMSEPLLGGVFAIRVRGDRVNDGPLR